MVRRNGVLSLTAWMVAAVIFVPSDGACLWCNPVQWQDFLDCMYGRMRNEPYFNQIADSTLDDMRNSITAASKPITSRGSSSMKMKMLVGAMAGEMSEVIKLMSPAESDGRPKDILMRLVQNCNVRVSGQPDLGFMNELSRTIDFMMYEPSYDNSELAPESNIPLQNADQSLRNPTSFNGQNIYGSPSDFNNVQQPKSELQLPTAKAMPLNDAVFQGNKNQQAPRGIPFPYNQYDGSRFPALTALNQRDLNAATLSNPSQPQILNTNRGSGFNTFNQNPSVTNVPNANAASNSHSLAQSAGVQQQINNANLERRPNKLFSTSQAENTNIGPESTSYPIKSGSYFEPQITRENEGSSADSFNLASPNTISNTDQNIAQNDEQNQYPPGYSLPINNQVPSYPTQILQNQQSRSQNLINWPQSPFGKSYTKTFEINAQNNPENNRKNQFIQYPNLKQQQNKLNGETNKKSPNDDDVAKAMRFVETIFVRLSQSTGFKGVFNEQIPIDQALSLMYNVVEGALNDCGFSRFAVEIANACTVVIESLPDGCSSVQYAEALSKALMDQLYIKSQIGENPEDQAKCIANNFLTRLNQKVPLTISTTTMQPSLAADSDSRFSKGLGSQPQGTNANSETYSYSLYQNSKNQPQMINTDGAKFNRPSTDQNILQNNVDNQYMRGQNVLINSAVPNNFINKLQNQPNFAVGPKNQQQDSLPIATNKNIRANPNLQNMDRTYKEDGIKNAANIFCKQLSNNLLSSPYVSNVYNKETRKAKAKTTTATLLIVSLSDYDDLAFEIGTECIKRLSSVQTGSNTETYTTLIATCITDVFSYYGLISPETPSAQASDISSKIIAYLKGDTNSRNNELPNTNIGVQNNLPNQGATDYTDSPSGIPNLSQWQQPASSEVSSSNSERYTDYNPNSQSLAPQYQQFGYQTFNSNFPPITNDGLQNIRKSSNINSSSLKDNANKDKNKKANKKNKKGPKKMKPSNSKTNFNFNNLNNNYPVNSEANTPLDIRKGNYLMDYNGNLNYQPDNVPYTQYPVFQSYPAQNINQDYDLTAGAIKINNDNISGPQQSSFVGNNSPRRKKCKKLKNGIENNTPNKPVIDDDLDTNYNPLNQIGPSAVVNNSLKRKKCKNLKNVRGNNATNKPPIRDDSYTSYNPLNKGGPPAVEMVNNPQTFQRNENKGSLNNDNDAIPNQNIPLVPSQSQIIPDETNDEVKNRIRYLIKALLSSMSNGKFDYKYFSDVISKVSENLLNNHPELGTETSLMKTLIDSITACTLLLTKVPPNYFYDIGILQNSDIPDAAIDYSNSILPTQGDQSTIQANQNNVAQNDQSYGLPSLPQQNNLSNDQIGQRNFFPSGSASLTNTNLPPRQSFESIEPNPNGNGFFSQSLPRDKGGNAEPNPQTLWRVSSQTGKDSLPILPNRSGSQNLPINNQNNFRFM